MYKDVNCGDLRKQDSGRQICIAGWVWSRRDHGGLIFVDLRDRSGVIQVVFNPDESLDTHQVSQILRNEWVVQIKGEVRLRKEGAQNLELPTGEVELIAQNIVILSKSVALPFEIDDRIKTNEDVRLRYRYLDLRRPIMQELMSLRHNVTRIIWEHLHSEGFLHVETPILLKSTPEGARDYVVPSRVHAGKFYALPQSPQQLKQILMVAGIEKYFQIARCFRDEDLRADRQPEHTQLDLEMSFVHSRDIMDTVEKLYTRIVNELAPDKSIFLKPFTRITYDESMRRFGTDKPDMRLGMELSDLTDIAKHSESRLLTNVVKQGGIVKGFSVPGGGNLSRRECDNLIETAKRLGAQGLIWISFDKSDTSIVELAQNQVTASIPVRYLSMPTIKAFANLMNVTTRDIMLIVAGEPKITNLVLSALRTNIGQQLNIANENELHFAWITDFPLFEWDNELSKWTPAHHVFSSPQSEFIEVLETSPGKVKGDLFDLVCNGSELGSGSIRIIDPELQKRVFGIIGYSEHEVQEKFGTLLECFKYGPPPHGGMGLGLDRIAALLGNTASIRNVIAFPKTQSAFDPMFEAPAAITQAQMDELCIRSTL